MTGDDLVERATWTQWRDAEQHALLTSSTTSKTVSFVCPELSPGDVLALVTDGGHPDLSSWRCSRSLDGDTGEAIQVSV